MEQNDSVNATPEGGQMPPQTPPPAVAVSEISQNEKQWAMFSQLAALVGLLGIPFGNLLGPLIVWLIKKEVMPFVNRQGKEAVNFQISCLIYGLVLSPTLCFPPLFILLILALGVVNVVFVIIASIAASKGEAYQYPLCLRLIK